LKGPPQISGSRKSAAVSPDGGLIGQQNENIIAKQTEWRKHPREASSRKSRIDYFKANE
jgi:hypothetical protein